MRDKRRITFMLVLSLSTFSCFTPALQREETSRSPQEGDRLRLEIPNAAWEPLFFEAINERAQRANLTSLRTTVMHNGDLEIRVWIGFGLGALRGFVIRRRSGQWSAIYLRPISRQISQDESTTVAITPRSGWERLWQRLVDEQILTLPDSSQLRDEVGINDGRSYVIEINANGLYRTYMYSNPQEQRWPEARQVIEISDILHTEFDIGR
jgi:hypothetical protein